MPRLGDKMKRSVLFSLAVLLMFSIAFVFTSCDDDPYIVGQITSASALQEAINDGNESIMLESGSYSFDEDLTITKSTRLYVESGEADISFSEGKGIVIAESVGNGDVSLEDLNITGKLTVNGGGSNSIHLKNTTITRVEMNKDSSAADSEVPRLALENGSKITGSLSIVKDAIIDVNTASDSTISATTVEDTATITLVGTNTEVLGNVADSANITTTVASVNGGYYKTLEEAIDSIETKGSIQLLGDIELATTIYIPQNIEVELDLNGKTITGNKTQSLIVDGGKLTISGEGEVYSDYETVSVINNGSAVINGGNYYSNTHIAISTGSYNAKTKEVSNGSVVINGGTIEAQEFAIAVFGDSTLVINDGVIEARDNAVIGTNGSSPLSSHSYSIEINGGTFNGNIKSPGYIACGIYMANTGKVTLNGGVFNIDGGVGVLVRSGELYANEFTVNLTNTKNLESGKVGDARILIVTTDSQIVVDKEANYPGETPTIKENTTSYVPKNPDGSEFV